MRELAGGGERVRLFLAREGGCICRGDQGVEDRRAWGEIKDPTYFLSRDTQSPGGPSSGDGEQGKLWNEGLLAGMKVQI